MMCLILSSVINIWDNTDKRVKKEQNGNKKLKKSPCLRAFLPELHWPSSAVVVVWHRYYRDLMIPRYFTVSSHYIFCLFQIPLIFIKLLITNLNTSCICFKLKLKTYHNRKAWWPWTPMSGKHQAKKCFIDAVLLTIKQILNSTEC